MVTDDFGCSDSVSTAVFYVGSTDLAVVETFNIYPNPAAGQFWIDLKLSEVEDVEIEIFNSIGQQIFHSFKENILSDTFLMNIEDWSSGIYWVCLKIGDKSLVKSIVK